MKRKRRSVKERLEVRKRWIGWVLFFFGLACMICSVVNIVLETPEGIKWLILTCLVIGSLCVISLIFSVRKHGIRLSAAIWFAVFLLCLLGLVYFLQRVSYSDRIIIAILVFGSGLVLAWCGRWLVSDSPSTSSQFQPPGGTPPSINNEKMVGKNLGLMGVSSIIPPSEGFTFPFQRVLSRLLYPFRLAFCVIWGVSLTLLGRLIASLMAAEKGSLAYDCFSVSLLSLLAAALLWWSGHLTNPLVRITHPLMFVVLSVFSLVFGLKSIGPMHHKS